MDSIKRATAFTTSLGHGEMARRVHSMDWATTPLGPMEGWPQALKIAVGICLNSRFPMFVWWGPEQINIYNDAYVPMLGKRHPAALGRPARTSWDDIWDVVGPQAEAVLTRGEATWNERVKLVMERNGYTEETWFTWSYSPILDERGRIGGMFCAVTEDTGRVLAERERDRLAQQRQLALDAARMGWWHYDPATKVATYDRRYGEIFGVDGAARPNDELLARVHPDDRARVWAAAEAAMDPAAPEPFSAAYRVVRDDGSERWVEAHGAATFDGEGAARRATSLVGTVADVTERKRAEVEHERLLASERAARAEAERASEAKSEFLATLSHELRTPLAPVLLTTSLMESHPGLPPELREDVTLIRRNVELESRLISDLLDLTRITNGKLQLDEQDVDLHGVVRSAIDICQREASAKLTVDLRATRSTVRGDSTRLQQVFWNLINNAIKFTPADGTITVRSSEAATGERIRIEVSDTGVGIDPAVLPRLFSAFEQGDARIERQQAGLGLGLAISKKLAEAHGGTIVAASDGRGRGATFTVELPASDGVPAEVAPALPAMMASGTVRPVGVLLVEDHEPTLRVMTKLLRAMGHRVTSASSVATAVGAAGRDGFDLIISDLGLPDGSGLDLMRLLHDKYAGRGIALTGYGMEADILASRSAGFAEHLIKPVDAFALEAAIHRVIGNQG